MSKWSKETETAVRIVEGPPPDFVCVERGIYQTRMVTKVPPYVLKNRILEFLRDSKTPLFEFDSPEGDRKMKALIIDVEIEDEDILNIKVRLDKKLIK